MSELSPKELDKLLQDGSEQYDFGYNPEAWQQMEHLLDKDKRRRRFIWWWLGAAGVLVFGILIGLWWKKEAENTRQQANPPATELPQTQKPAATQETPNPTPKKSHSAKTFKQAGILEKKEAWPINTETPVLKNKKEIDKTKGASAVPFAPQQLVFQNNAPEELPSNLDKKNKEKNVALAPLPGLPFAIVEMEAKEESAFPLPDFALVNANFPRVEAHKNKTFLIGLTTSATSASAGLDHFSKLNNPGIGGQLELRAGGKYSAGIGAQYSRVKYKAGAGKYLHLSDFWIRGIEPESTYATCKILEVPLWFGYYPGGYSKTGFYTKIGLSSYFMLKEYYHYNYAVYEADLLHGWGEKNGSQHWFGLGFLSAGYNQVLGRKTSLQIAPYLEIPLTGVGHGKIKLWSAGLNLSFNFQVN